MAKRVTKKVIRPVKKATRKTIQKEENICFVIMPFGGWFDNYFRGIYIPAIENSGLIPRRADDLFRPSNIVQDIWELTKKSKIILADLTHKNPNVFYELGLAHAIAKPAILITETIDDIPFDLRSLRIIEYDKNEPSWGTILQQKIENAIRESLEFPNQTVPTAFLEVSRADIKTPQVSQQEKDFIEMKQDLDQLKRQYSNPTISSSRPVTSAELKERAAELLAGGMSVSDVANALNYQYDLSLRIASDIAQSMWDERTNTVRSIIRRSKSSNTRTI